MLRKWVDNKMSIRSLNPLNEDDVTKTFKRICRKLSIKSSEGNMRNLIIYEMIDGMRTSADLGDTEAYIEGGFFSARLIYLLKLLGAEACYINVTEEKHKFRLNYPIILNALGELYPFYEKYAESHNIKLKFLGRTDESTDSTALFMRELRLLENKTANNTGFVACFLINYSLEWAMQNLNLFKTLPNVNVIIRHTKLQAPTGMLLPPSKSDNTSLVYVQQGAPSKTWSDYQILCLIALALKSMLSNEGTQYTKTYQAEETERIKIKREIEATLVHKQLFGEEKMQRVHLLGKNSYRIKRAILGTSFGPEIYEF